MSDQASAGAEGQPPTAQTRSVLRRCLLWLRRLLTAGVVLALLLGAVGQVVRDRSWPWFWLFYFRMPVLGLGALLLELVCAGRCLRPRFGLALVGLVVTVWSAASLTGFGSDRTEQPGRQAVGLLQWNVHWGGGRTRTDATWAAIVAEIEQRSPDVIVLSEAPEKTTGWLPQLGEGRGWHSVQCESAPDEDYWYRLVVCTRRPIRFERDEVITNGHVMSVVVTVQDRPVRLLVVDGESNPRLSRVDMLHDVVERCRAGEPIDILAGDFNTPSRSIGFDPFADLAGGYRLASRSAYGWRATWPSNCPLFDIDHVWLRRDFPVRDCELFTNLASDHRGQIVHFYLPAAP